MGMAHSAERVPATIRSYRSRAVLVAGCVDLAVGLCALLVGIDLAASSSSGSARPVGLAICILSVVLIGSGVGRMRARIELEPTTPRWTWAFSTHELPLDGLMDAALIEKGAPASGAAWAGFPGGGFPVVLAWWLVDTVSSVVRSGPSLGSLELVVISRHGGPVAIPAISAWSTPSAHARVDQVLESVQAAISSSARTTPPGPPSLLHDDWEQPGFG